MWSEVVMVRLEMCGGATLEIVGFGLFKHFHPSLHSGRGELMYFSEILKIIFEELSIILRNNKMFAFCFRNIEVGFLIKIVFFFPENPQRKLASRKQHVFSYTCV